MKIPSILFCSFLLIMASLMMASPVSAVDSYRYCEDECQAQYEECQDEETMDPESCDQGMDQCEQQCAAEQSKISDGDANPEDVESDY